MSFFIPNITDDWDPIVFECDKSYEPWLEVTKYLLQVIYLVPGGALNALIFYTIWFKKVSIFSESSYFVIYSTDCVASFIILCCDVTIRFLMYFSPLCPILSPFFFEPLVFFKGVMIAMNHFKTCKYVIQSFLVLNRMTCVIYPNGYTRIWKSSMKIVIPLIFLIPLATDWNLAISRVYMKPNFGGFSLEYIKKVSWASQSRFQLIFISIAMFFTVICTSVTLYTLFQMPNRLIKFEKLITIASALTSIGYLILAVLQSIFGFFPALFSGSMMFGIAQLSYDLITVGTPIVMLCVSGGLREHTFNLAKESTETQNRVFTVVNSSSSA